MKRLFILIIVILLLSHNLFASPKNDFNTILLKFGKRFEMEATLNFWYPFAMDIKPLNAKTTGNGTTDVDILGYGSSVIPEVELKYYFNKNLALSFGGNIVYLDNTISYYNNNYVLTQYENLGVITNLLLGLTVKNNRKSDYSTFFETGIDLVPYYFLSMSASLSFSSNAGASASMDANGYALGIYSKIGVNINIVNFFSLYSAIVLNYVPETVTYYNNDDPTETITAKTNFGGIGIQLGVLFDFDKL